MQRTRAGRHTESAQRPCHSSKDTPCEADNELNATHARWTSHRISEASTPIVDSQHPRHSPHRYRAQRCAAVWFAEPRSIGLHHTAPRSIDMNHTVLRSLVSAELASAARKSASSLAVQPLHHAVLRRLVSAEPASAARKSASPLAVQPLSSASVPALGHMNATC